MSGGSLEVVSGLAWGGGTPRVVLIDARVEGLDEVGLRARARAEAAGAGAEAGAGEGRAKEETDAEARAEAEAAGAGAGAGAGHFSSRSYRFPLALVAWNDGPIGVDIERVEPCDEAFADSIRTPAERAAGWPAGDADRFFSSLWSSKEALAKALGDALAYDPRRLEGPGAWPDGRAGPWHARALELGPEHVGWVCWRPR